MPCSATPRPARGGAEAREALEVGRAQVAALIGARPGEIIFTGSGTKADDLAILGASTPGTGRRT